MVESGRLCILIVLQVTGNAVGPQSGKLADGRIDVAGGAIHRGVGSQKRKPVLMLLDCPDGDVPSLHGMAVFTTRPKLATVQVGMAIGALCAHVLEDQFHVTRAAGHFLVHSAKRVTRLVVVELGETANRFPTRARVAALAGNFEGTVRIVCRTTLVRLRQTEAHSSDTEQKYRAESLDAIPKGHESPTCGS